MKTAISLPDELFRAAELVAERLGLSRSELYQKALAAFLEKHQPRSITEKLDEVYADRDSTLDPVVESMQTSSVPVERSTVDSWWLATTPPGRRPMTCPSRCMT